MMTEELKLTRQEAIRQLHVAPRLFRQLCEQYQHHLGAVKNGVSTEQFGILGRVVAMRAEGLGEEEIERNLAEEPPATPLQEPDLLKAVADERTPEEKLLMAHLHDLSEEMKRAEERREQDRDRLLTALMRTQQEISHLRYELAAKTGRRSRKPGLFQRILG